VIKKSLENELQYQLKEADSAKLIFEVKNLPKRVIAFFKQEYIVLADTGKYYNATDLRFDYTTPNARIVFGGSVSKDFGFALYESQGITTQSHLLIFKFQEAKEIYVERKIINCRPVDFLSLKNCLR